MCLAVKYFTSVCKHYGQTCCASAQRFNYLSVYEWRNAWSSKLARYYRETHAYQWYEIQGHWTGVSIHVHFALLWLNLKDCPFPSLASMGILSWNSDSYVNVTGITKNVSLCCRLLPSSRLNTTAMITAVEHTPGVEIPEVCTYHKL